MKIISAYFEITNFCNLNCCTCYNRSGLNGVQREISTANLRRAIEALIPLGLKRVILSGGEPVLHTEFDDIIDLINIFPELFFGVSTNGTVHNRKLIEVSNAENRLTLQISLDGSCEEVNAVTRGAGKFEKTVGFAGQIKKRNPKPLLKMVLSQNNINDAENFYRLALSLGYVPEFAFIYKVGNGAAEWDNKSLTAQQKLNTLKLIGKLNNETQTEALLPFCAGKCPYAEGTENMSVCIKTDGSVQPCQMMYNDEYTLGNIFSFDKINFKNKADAFVEIVRKRTQNDFGCLKCLLRDNCGKGCPAAAVNLHGDPLGTDSDCGFRKMQFVGYDLKAFTKI